MALSKKASTPLRKRKERKRGDHEKVKRSDISGLETGLITVMRGRKKKEFRGSFFQPGRPKGKRKRNSTCVGGGKGHARPIFFTRGRGGGSSRRGRRTHVYSDQTFRAVRTIDQRKERRRYTGERERRKNQLFAVSFPFHHTASARWKRREKRTPRGREKFLPATLLPPKGEKFEEEGGGLIGIFYLSRGSGEGGNARKTSERFLSSPFHFVSPLKPGKNGGRRRGGGRGGILDYHPCHSLISSKNRKPRKKRGVRGLELSLSLTCQTGKRERRKKGCQSTSCTGFFSHENRRKGGTRNGKNSRRR